MSGPFVNFVTANFMFTANTVMKGVEMAIQGQGRTLRFARAEEGEGKKITNRIQDSDSGQNELDSQYRLQIK